MRTRMDPNLVPEGLRTEHLIIDHGRVSIFVGSVARSACCPACDRRSRRTYSRYWRTVSDLPWHGTPVTLKVRARRFFCDEPSCERRIFCERLPELSESRIAPRLGHKPCYAGVPRGWRETA